MTIFRVTVKHGDQVYTTIVDAATRQAAAKYLRKAKTFDKILRIDRQKPKLQFYD